MELNENTGRIGLGFIPTYQRLGSLKRKLSLGGKPVLTGIRERERKSLAYSNGTDELRQLLLGQKYGGRISR
ncbi:MAG: hypothetical protein WA393_11150 [Nitrososphaeraceae archaeon]